MLFNPWTFAFELLNFVVLVVILERVFYGPLHRALDQRREAMARVQAEAQEASNRATEMQLQLTAQLSAIEQQREAMLLQANEAIAAERARALVAAEQHAERRRTVVEQELQETHRAAAEALQSDLVFMAVGVVERLLGEISDSTLHQQLYRHLLETLNSVPPSDGSDASPPRSGDVSALLEVAQPIDPSTLSALQAALVVRLGPGAALNVVQRPDLISGVRLIVGGRVWDASLAGLLTEARQSLVKAAPGG